MSTSDCVATNFVDIKCIDRSFLCSQNNSAENVFTDSRTSIDIFIQTTRQWTTEENRFDQSKFLGRIIRGRPSSLTSFKGLRHKDLLQHPDLITTQYLDLESNLRSVTSGYDISHEQINILKQDISDFCKEVAEDIVDRKPRDIQIGILIQILITEVCDERTFNTYYGELFREGSTVISSRSPDYKNALLSLKYEEEEGLNQNMCAICLEEFAQRVDIMITPCSHVFHKKCIKPWLEKIPTCPFCRLDVYVFCSSSVSDHELDCLWQRGSGGCLQVDGIVDEETKCSPLDHFQCTCEVNFAST